jgi:hypothetical protein
MISFAPNLTVVAIVHLHSRQILVKIKFMYQHDRTLPIEPYNC